ncbi:MAG: DNA primase [Thermoproteales archaeon]|nr:DNA primase [Thermoproteales archaeon]
MGGPPVNAKYVIYASIEVDGIVEKPDIIGAIFGQTENILGEDLDLRELRKSGRIGRIDVKLENKSGRIRGTIIIPSNLDRAETALIAAAIEIVDKVGPYSAKVKVFRIEDVRAEKRKKIIERAKEILRKWSKEEMPETRELTEEVLKAIREAEVIKYGPEGLSAGPDVDRADTVIIVEGRADVVNLLKHGYKNVIAVGGATVPKTIVELSKKKTTIAFVDGDRGGELILKNLASAVDIDYVARAPPGREVEELTGKEIAKCLRNKLPAEEYFESISKEKASTEKVREEAMTEVEALEVKIPDHIIKNIESLKGTLLARIYNDKWELVKEVPVRDLVSLLKEEIDSVYAVIFDGIITQRIVDAAYSKDAKILVGARIGDATRIPEKLVILSYKDILGQ